MRNHLSASSVNHEALMDAPTKLHTYVACVVVLVLFGWMLGVEHGIVLGRQSLLRENETSVAE